ncbi:MAG TPA: anthranilate synthase component I family protein [Gammaproteobacteria bacterium]|nr:anthranilate synthase component I family protein [Gammaproteobacteria bacterium]
MESPFDIAADLDTPVSAYLKLKPFKPRFLLESVENGERLARYSFIGFGEGLTLELKAGALYRNGRPEAAPANREEWLSLMRAALSASPELAPDIPGLPFSGGLVGTAGYEVVRYFERLPAHGSGPSSTHVAAFVAPESLLVFDHLTRRVALLHAGSEQERLALRAEVVKALCGGIETPRPSGHFSAAKSGFPKSRFLDSVSRAKDYIKAGDIYQIVLSERFSGRSDLDPFQTYRGLRLLNPSPYMYFFELGDLKIAGSSPEALVRLERREASLRPIAGTRPRGATPEQDSALETELLADPKENAEHVMLVDLARNDLGRVARAGSVHVQPYRSIERYSHVMHIVSGVRGQLESGRDAFDLFAAAFPAGTLVGAPKVRAMQLIAELEPVGRGLYGGTVGYFGKNGNMDQAITIRTIVFEGDEYSFQAGAGIVADSVPEKEYDEVLAKSAILRRALELAEEGL